MSTVARFSICGPVYCVCLGSFTSFQIFYNEEFDCRTPEDWLALGREEGSTDQKPIPAKAFLPTDDTGSAGTDHSQASNSILLADIKN